MTLAIRECRRDTPEFHHPRPAGKVGNALQLAAVILGGESGPTNVISGPRGQSQRPILTRDLRALSPERAVVLRFH
jgi:hypothetical protein